MTITRKIGNQDVTIELSNAELLMAKREYDLLNADKLLRFRWYMNHDGDYPFEGIYHDKLVEFVLHRTDISGADSWFEIADEVIDIGLRVLPLVKYMPDGCLPLGIKNLY